MIYPHLHSLYSYLCSIHPTHLQLAIAGLYLISGLAFAMGVSAWFAVRRGIYSVRSTFDQRLRTLHSEMQSGDRTTFTSAANKVAGVADDLGKHIAEAHARRPRKSAKRRR